MVSHRAKTRYNHDMKNLFLVITALSIFSCAARPVQPEVLQTKLAIGMSSSDVMAILGLPDQKDPGKLVYPGYIMKFTDNKLQSVQKTSSEPASPLQLKDISQQNPSYTPDSLVLNKDLKLELSAFQIAGFLKDEELFLKAVDSGINRNGFTTKSNALCVALVEGFSKGAEAVMKAGYNPNLQLRTDRGTYIFPPQCVSLQKDAALAEQFTKQVSESTKEQEAKKTDEEKKEESKSAFDWQEIKEFLKPTSPPPTSNINR